MQINLEGIFRDFYPDRLLICDRGTLDGLAYWPDDEGSYFESVGTTFEAEAARYAAVIFFQTAAIHGEDVKGNNPYRRKHSRTAVKLDEKLRRVWERHPNFHFIPTEMSFMGKINRGLKAIATVLKELQADSITVVLGSTRPRESWWIKRLLPIPGSPRINRARG